MTGYMFQDSQPLYARARSSLFHGWLPFLLLFVVYRLGYDPPCFAGVDGPRLDPDVDCLLLIARPAGSTINRACRSTSITSTA